MASSARLLTTSIDSFSGLRSTERPSVGARGRPASSAVELGLGAAQRFQRDSYVLGACFEQRAVAVVLRLTLGDQFAEALPVGRRVVRPGERPALRFQPLERIDERGLCVG